MSHLKGLPHIPTFDSSYRYRPFQVERSLAGNHDTLTGMPAKQLSTPFLNLKTRRM
jgi:hypothetical protein